MQTQAPYHKPAKTFWFLIGILLVCGSFLSGYLVGAQGTSDGLFARLFGGNTSASPSFQLLDRVWEVIQSQYVHQPVDMEKAVYGAARGLVESLEDPYTVFLSPEESQVFQQEIEGTFEGIGAEIGIKENRLVIVAPLKGSPAEAAGLTAGDFINAIDGEDTTGLPLDEAVSKIRGAKDTVVVLTIQKPDSESTEEVSVTRGTITVDSVTVTFTDDQIANVELTYFGPETAGDFRAIANEIVVKNAKGIVLDLRNNPGGYLDAAVNIAGEFLDRGQTVVIERITDGSQTTFSAKDDGALRGIPLVILVDGGSASASEIVAGALQDYGIGKLVGTTTFGKGSVQQLEELPDGSHVKVTVAEWLTPNGRSINQKGIEPDIAAERTREDFDAGRDPQLDAALAELRQSSTE